LSIKLFSQEEIGEKRRSSSTIIVDQNFDGSGNLFIAAVNLGDDTEKEGQLPIFRIIGLKRGEL
jgi:hypothetical protein